MKQYRFSWKLISLLLFFISCNHSENDKLIIGNWSGIEWMKDDEQSNLNAKDTHFSFDDKGKYTYEYPGMKEEGTYKVENDMLFTKPANQQEMMVKIARLTKDTLVFEMNRSGIGETLTLVKN